LTRLFVASSSHRRPPLSTRLNSTRPPAQDKPRTDLSPSSSRLLHTASLFFFIFSANDDRSRSGHWQHAGTSTRPQLQPLTYSLFYHFLLTLFFYNFLYCTSGTTTSTTTRIIPHTLPTPPPPALSYHTTRPDYLLQDVVFKQPPSLASEYLSVCFPFPLPCVRFRLLPRPQRAASLQRLSFLVSSSISLSVSPSLKALLSLCYSQTTIHSRSSYYLSYTIYPYGASVLPYMRDGAPHEQAMRGNSGVLSIYHPTALL